ncbi:hypothetical protein [Streptomyces griseosporeus]|uniref:hypothetical protein n=1 Tax=Streptomyces griseosporeus TaxID=1910 RepID=UPI0036FAAC8D
MPHFQTCRRHPNAGPFLATCSGCAQELHDLQYGKPAPDPTREAARKALATIGTTVNVTNGAYILSVRRVGDALIVATDQPASWAFPYAVDVFRLPTAEETDPEQTDPRTPGEWILIDQYGGHSRSEVAEMVASAEAYLVQLGFSNESALAAA